MALLVGSYWNESLPAPATDEACRCQAAVVSYGGNPGPSIVHNGKDPVDPDDGTDVLSWQEELTLLTRFYGPQSGILCRFAEVRLHGQTECRRAFGAWNRIRFSGQNSQ